jgi:hypothetical protein
MEVVNHFGPALVSLSAEDRVVETLNRYSDQVLSNDRILEKLDFTENLGGAVHGSFKIKVGFFNDVEEYLMRSANQYLETFAPHLKEEYNLKLQTMWVVSQKEGTWSYLHDHNCDLAGIIYLKVPKEPAHGLPPEDVRARYPGGITFVQGTPGPFHRATFTIKPQVGAFYIFPAKLLHTVYPFFGPEERRSFSFNMKLVNKD